MKHCATPWLVIAMLLLTLGSCQKLKNQIDPNGGSNPSTTRNIFNFPIQEGCRVTRYFNNGGTEQLFSYNSEKQLASFTIPQGGKVLYEYNDKGLPSVIRNFNREKISLQYDGENRLTMLYFYDPNLLDSVRITYPTDHSVKAEYYLEEATVQYSRTTLFNDAYDVVSQEDQQVDNGSLVPWISTSFEYDLQKRNAFAATPAFGFLTIVLPELGVGNSMFASQHAMKKTTILFYDNNPPEPQVITQTVSASNAQQFPTKASINQAPDPTVEFNFEYSCD